MHVVSLKSETGAKFISVLSKCGSKHKQTAPDTLSWQSKQMFALESTYVHFTTKMTHTGRHNDKKILFNTYLVRNLFFSSTSKNVQTIIHYIRKLIFLRIFLLLDLIKSSFRTLTTNILRMSNALI